MNFTSDPFSVHRFLHDILTNLINQQKVYEGLYGGDELDSAKVTVCLLLTTLYLYERCPRSLGKLPLRTFTLINIPDDPASFVGVTVRSPTRSLLYCLHLYQDRDSKVAFLQKMVTAVQYALGVTLAVRPLKVCFIGVDQTTQPYSRAYVALERTSPFTANTARGKGTTLRRRLH